MGPAKKAKISKSSLISNINRRLHTSSVPESLPCRDREYEDIYCFLESKLRERVGGCMYISGVPGTGKTATVLEVMKALSGKSDECKGGRRVKGVKGGIASFRFIEVNGLKLSEPHQAYTWIYREMSGIKMAAKKACDALEHYFLKGGNSKDKEKDELIVLMADELDLLCTSKQTILYHLFDWPNHAESNLIVIAIANAMDLPERVMMQRIASRLGLTRLTFQPYSYQELHRIIVSRLTGLDSTVSRPDGKGRTVSRPDGKDRTVSRPSGLDCFDDDAIELVSRKVAAVSGDARRALDICRRAVLIAENKMIDGVSSETDVHSVGKVSTSGKRSKTPRSGAKELKPVERDPSCPQLSVKEKECEKFVVKVKDVQDALQEIFSSIKIVAIQSASEQEQIILHSIVKEFRSSGLEETTFIQVYKHLHSQTTFQRIYTPTIEEAYQILITLYQLRFILLHDNPYAASSFFNTKIRLNLSTDDIDFALKSIDE